MKSLMIVESINALTNGASLAKSVRKLIAIRLTRKFTECLNGFDLSQHSEGDVLEVSDEDAQMLISEGCAERVHIERRMADRRKIDRPER
jgi:hypothetical protein